jgi:hypothetical protein
MKISKIIFILTIFISLNGCSVSQKSLPNLTNRENKLTDNQPLDKQRLAGSWSIYQTKKGEGRKMCGKEPCGLPSSFEIFADGSELKGRVLLGYNSTASPPHPDWGEVLIELQNEKYVMSYTLNPFGCDEKYTIEGFTNDSFYGTYEAKGCNIAGKISNKEGDFTAVRFVKQSN